MKDSSAALELKNFLSNLKSGDTKVILVYKDKEISSGMSVEYNESLLSGIKSIKGIVNIEKLI